MVISKGALFLINLLLALSLGHSQSEKDPITEQLDECLDRCHSLRWGMPLVHSCEARCAQDYYNQRQQEVNTDTDMDMGTNQDDPSVQYKVEKCKQKCETGKPYKRPECIQKCDFKYAEQQQPCRERPCLWKPPPKHRPLKCSELDKT